MVGRGRWRWIGLAALLVVGMSAGLVFVRILAYRPGQADLRSFHGQSSRNPATPAAVSSAGASASTAQSPPAGSQSGAASTCPDIVVRRTVSLPMIPRQEWVNASDGVNVRAAPSMSGERIATLPVGTHLGLNWEQKNPDGNTWYEIRLDDGRDGWLLSRYAVNYAIKMSSSPHLTVALPDGYVMRLAEPGHWEARFDDAPLAFLYFQTGTVSALPAQPFVPVGLPSRSTWTEDHVDQVLVGDTPASDHVFRISIGKDCPALLHQVTVTTISRYYAFLFLLDEPSSSVVAQLLESAIIQ